MKSHADALQALGYAPSSKGKRPRARRARPALPTALLLQALAAVVVGVDPGLARSGWSIWVRGRLVRWGEINDCNPVAIKRVMDAAAELAELAGADAGLYCALPVVLVCEKAPPAAVAFKSTGYAHAGSSAARNVWRFAWRSAGYSDRRFVLVALSRWRSKVLGRGWGGAGVDRAEVRRQEQRTARAVAAAYLGTQEGVGPDAAPAILIGRYGCYAPEVARAIEPTARRGRARAKGTGYVARETGAKSNG